MDIYVKKYKPGATPRETVHIGRIVAIAGAAIAVFLAMAIDSIKGLNLFNVFQAILGFIAPPMSVVFLFGVLWKETTTRAANFVLSAGTALSFLIGVLYLWVFPADKYDFWPHFLLLSFYIFVLLAVAAFLISLFDRKQGAPTQLDFGEIPKPSKTIWISWGLLIAIMISLYIIFNGH